MLFFVAVGGYFGVKKLQQTKKSVSISNEKIEAEQPIQSQDESINQSVEISSQDGLASGQNLASDKKQAEVAKKETNAKEQTPVEDKAASAGKIVSKLVSWGFQKTSARTIKAIIVHTSYNALGGDLFDFNKVIQEWKDAGVAPHYAIDRKGTIYQLVADNNIAWHAGVSKLPDGTTDVNGASIGVEVINSQDAKFTDEQYAALNSLIGDLQKKYKIKYILGHDEIAPGRKTDPWNIEWKKVNR